MSYLSSCDLPVGASVRWRAGLGGSPLWAGVVTAHGAGNMVQCDGNGMISAGLLERTDDVDRKTPGMTGTDFVKGYWESQDKIGVLLRGLDTAEAERDGLAEVVAMQADVIGELSAVRPDEWRDTLRRLLDYHLQAVCGTTTPELGDTTLAALIRHIRGRG